MVTLRDLIAAAIGAGATITITQTIKIVIGTRSNNNSFNQIGVKGGGDVAGRDIRKGK